MPSVAVLDIGSNSIKILVVERAANGELKALLSETIEARISQGINQANPSLSDEAMRRGLGAIRELIALSIPYDPIQTQLVATSAVRDANNSAAFQQVVFEATGHRIKVLSGTEEANLIGQGITCDPALTDLHDFQLFDLGGGSMECLSFKDRHLQRAESLQLGCVRLTEKFITDRTAPLGANELQSIYDFSAQTLQDREWPCSPVATTALEARQSIRGLPPARADVFPTALTTLLAVAVHGGFSAYHHSLFNLRYGVVAEMLDVITDSSG